MSDVTNVGYSLKQLDTAPSYEGYSKVVVRVSDELEYHAGTDTGKVLIVESPWGTQQSAESILSRLRGFRYQPYSATAAHIDPATELGDGISVGGLYSGVYAQNIKFGRSITADVSAPFEEALDHEYPYKSQEFRRIERLRHDMSSEFSVQANLIAAKVSRTGGSSESFGWTLTEEGFVLAAGGFEVFNADRTGVRITGRITATSGYIGDEGSGFSIGSRDIHNGVLSMTDTAHYGVYIGTDGIVLGKGAFKVDAQGNLTANSGTFSGYVQAGKIQHGGTSGTLSGGAITPQTISGGSGGAIRGSTLSNFNLTGGINTSLGYADYSNLVFNGINRIPNLLTSQANITNLIIGNRLTLGQKRIGSTVISFKNSQDTITTVNVLTWEYA